MKDNRMSFVLPRKEQEIEYSGLEVFLIKNLLSLPEKLFLFGVYQEVKILFHECSLLSSQDHKVCFEAL